MRSHSGCHGNLVAVEMRCMLPQETFTGHMKSVWFKTIELLRFHSGCHGNLVTTATRYVTDAYCLRKPCCEIWTQYDLRQRRIEVSLWLPWQPSYHGIQVCGWCLSSQGTSMPNMSSIQLKAKELLMFHSGCHGNWVTIAARYVADSYCPKQPPCQIWTQYNLRQVSY